MTRCKMGYERKKTREISAMQIAPATINQDLWRVNKTKYTFLTPFVIHSTLTLAYPGNFPGKETEQSTSQINLRL